MKLIISKNQLNEAIQHVSKAITNRTTIPILTGIKIDVSSDGLILTASDTDISIQCFIAVQQDEKEIITVKEEGSIVLPAKIFVEMIRKLPEQHVEIEVKSNYHTMIRSGTTELQLMGLDPEEYPVLPKLDEQKMITLPANLLKSMIKETSFAVSNNESTPVLTGVQWQFSEHDIKCIATDRHRLASRQTNIEQVPTTLFDNIVISGKTLNELNKIIPDQETTVEIIVADNQVLFKIDHILFYSRLLDGAYPDTSKIIPQEYKTELVLNKKIFLDAIDRAFVLSREENMNVVNLKTLENNVVEISSSLSEHGQITDQITAEKMNGDDLRISFNSKYMLDALKAIEGEIIHVSFTGAMSPIIIKPSEDAMTLQLILPYRTH